MGSLSLLQGVFLTQELNWDLLLCRWILHQLSHQGSLSCVLPTNRAIATITSASFCSVSEIVTANLQSQHFSLFQELSLL